MIQKTLGIIKPDATERNLIGSILSDIEASGLKIIDLKKIRMSSPIAELFYSEHVGKPFFEDLTGYMTSGDVVVFSIEGVDAVKKYRALMGSTDPETAEEGTLRQKYALSKGRNSVHGSDSLESAHRELNIFFN